MNIRIGTCGYQYYQPEAGWQDSYESKLAAYADIYPAVELNRTFYDLPQVNTAERWRREVSQEFEFTVKAWQAITHPWRSPTWNTHRDSVPSEHTESLGYFRPTDPVLEAWRETRRIAEALESNVVIFQTPPSFDATDAHEANIREFFNQINRSDLTIGWEPRGTWTDYPNRVRAICEELDLVYVFDIMRQGPPNEIEILAARLMELAETNKKVYCFFNNFEMHENAIALMEELRDESKQSA